MRYLNDGLLLLVRTASPGPPVGSLNEKGWGAAALLIFASSMALAVLAWFLVGLLVN
jgi:hypothetical protein